MTKATQTQSGSEPMTLGNMTSPEDFHRLAEQEAALARAALTNESRADHYAMAAYYARLAEAKKKLATTAEVMASVAGGKLARVNSKHPPGNPMTLGEMRHLGVQRLVAVQIHIVCIR
jgi:hypothetical protein